MLHDEERLGDGAPREWTGDADVLALRGANMVAVGMEGGARGALAAAEL
jgi:hypothetical protein